MRALAYVTWLTAFVLISHGTPAHAGQARHPGAVLLAEQDPDAAQDAKGAQDAKPAQDAKDADDADDDQEPTPEEKMEARFPQPVRVGFLIGLPMLDWGDSTIGYIRNVVRTPEGKIELVVGIGGWFGYWPRRAVAVPLEAVAILARQVDALDLSREQIEAEPTLDAAQGQPIDPNDMITIALGRR
jgi:hypothetical protein